MLCNREGESSSKKGKRKREESSEQDHGKKDEKIEYAYCGVAWLKDRS